MSLISNPQPSDSNETELQRKIIHIDMDAFFASVEQLDNPELRGLPVIVGGKPNSRGVVAACSYDARKFGIHSAMPCSQAYRKCPQAIFISPRINRYREVSATIQHIFQCYSNKIEPLSLDEAFLDVTGSSLHSGSATRIAKAIKNDVRKQTGLIASAGVSYNKFLAKTASDMDKPDGLFVIRPDQAQAVIDSLPIRGFFGIGKATEQKMKKLGIHNGADLRAANPQLLQTHFGKSGRFYSQIAKGIDLREVRPHRTRKSIGSETTFKENLICEQDMLMILYQLTTKVMSELEKKQLSAKQITIKIKFSDFTQITRGQTVKEPFSCLEDSEWLQKIVLTLLQKANINKREVRLLGVSISHLNPIADSKDPQQLTIF